MRGLLRKKAIWVGLAFGVVAAMVGLWAFQPWKLWTHSEVNESLPTEFAAPATTGPATGESLSAAVPTMSTEAAAPAVLAMGEFVTQEHETRGSASVLSSGDTRILRLEGFSTSDGPDLHIWLSDATAGGEWGKYDDGRYLALGPMKATDGNQNYAIPADVDLAGLRSVVVWCDRFNVAFGSAPLVL
ncbi:DM13 domain-containing protein [Actinosynnema sp. NPDC050436]|uniref:DM13 domain-containing protein n=1 Tax=Actinosynnema sp. NPDC050436 TaxID=3155659 RepID=UPI00340590D6